MTCCQVDSCNAITPLCIVAGEDKTVEVTVRDPDTREPLDLTGGEVFFTMRSAAGGPVVLAKKSSTPSQILILDQTQKLGKANILFVPDDTASIASSEPYQYDVWAVLASGLHRVVTAKSPLEVRAAVTTDFTP